MLESAGHNQQPVDVDPSGLRPNPQTTQLDSGIEITLCLSYVLSLFLDRLSTNIYIFVVIAGSGIYAN